MSASVLVVDDDLQVTKLVTGILVSRGYEVRDRAGEAESAMASIGDRPPALVARRPSTYRGSAASSGAGPRARATSNVPIIVMSDKTRSAHPRWRRSIREPTTTSPSRWVTDRLLAPRAGGAFGGARRRRRGPALGVGRVLHRLREINRVQVNGRIRASDAEGIRFCFVYMARHPKPGPSPTERCLARCGARRRKNKPEYPARLHGGSCARSWNPIHRTPR